MPISVFVWLSPVILIFLGVFFEQRNKLLKQSIDNLNDTIKRLTHVLDKQETIIDDITERVVRLETAQTVLSDLVKDIAKGGSYDGKA